MRSITKQIAIPGGHLVLVHLEDAPDTWEHVGYAVPPRTTNPVVYEVYQYLGHTRHPRYFRTTILNKDGIKVLEDSAGPIIKADEFLKILMTGVNG